MMLPALLPLAVISFVPLVYIVRMSFSHVSLLGGVKMRWIGWENWTHMFTDSAVLSSWRISGVYFVSSLALEMLLGIGIALVVHEVVFARSVVLSLLLMPMFVAPVIVGLLGRFMLDPTFGLYAWIVRHLGGSDNLLGETSTALPSTILMDVWEWTPLIFLITLAGLTSVSQHLIDAATLDGAGYWKRLRYVVLPSISGVLLVALLIRAMDAIRYFDIIWITTNGGPADSTKVVPLRLYETAFRFFDLGYASALGLGMLAVTILVAKLFVRLLQSRGATA